MVLECSISDDDRQARSDRIVLPISSLSTYEMIPDDGSKIEVRKGDYVTA